MANIRDLKKDIKAMVDHFVQECYTHLAYSPPTNQENVLDIISDAMDLKESVLKRINNPVDNADRKAKKVYYKSLANDFYDSIVELTERLNSLSY